MRNRMIVEDNVKTLAEILLVEMFHEKQYLTTIDIDTTVAIKKGQVHRIYNVFYRGGFYFAIDWFGNLEVPERTINIFDFVATYNKLEIREDLWEEYFEANYAKD